MTLYFRILFLQKCCLLFDNGSKERQKSEENRRGGTETEGGGGKTEETHLQKEGVAEKRPRTDRSNTETEAGGEVAPSQSGCKKEHMTSIYLTTSDEEAIVDFIYLFIHTIVYL